MNALASLTHSRLVAAVVFLALLLGSAAAIAFSVNDVLDRKRALSDSEELLAQLRARGVATGTDTQLPGSPFLEGPTLTVAGATLLQRVAGAVANAGGTLQSSQIDVEGAANRGGMIKLAVNCEVDQPSLQGLLYDLEAGVPFLYIDQLDVAASQTTPSATMPMRMRLVLNVSGQWRGRP